TPFADSGRATRFAHCGSMNSVEGCAKGKGFRKQGGQSKLYRRSKGGISLPPAMTAPLQDGRNTIARKTKTWDMRHPPPESGARRTMTRPSSSARLPGLEASACDQACWLELQ